MDRINRQPSRRDLKIFGTLLGAFVLVFGLVMGARFESRSLAQWIWIGGGILTAVFFILPPVRRPIYLAWMYAAFPIGWTMSRAILAVVFFGIVTPIGVVLRLTRRDPMNRRLDASAPTYWEPCPPRPNNDRYFRQF